MIFAIPPVEINPEFPINEILDRTNDYYRKALEDSLMGELLLAKKQSLSSKLVYK